MKVPSADPGEGQKDDDDGELKLKFDVRLDRGMIGAPAILCALESDGRIRTLIAIISTITDKSHPAHPVTVSYEAVGVLAARPLPQRSR